MELSDAELRNLEAHHFDRAQFARLRERYRSGELTPESNRIDATIRGPAPDDILEIPAEGSELFREAVQLGVTAIDGGEVAHVVLNGGMATRFGGVVKGTVEVSDGVSFLGLKLRDAARWNGAVPVLLMNSFATTADTDRHLRENDYFGFDPERVWQFEQNIAVRLQRDGELFRENGGSPSFYGPGHGDLPSALNRGVLQRFCESGGRYVFMSNVDNVLATVDPLIVGLHVLASMRGIEMTIEAAPRYEGDKGGMPARVGGRLQVVEAFRLPEAFDTSRIDVFNTNTFIFDAASLERDFDLTWFVVEKQVAGEPVIQFERLAGELSAFLECQFLRVSREGASSRFLPVKTPEDLESSRAYLRTTMMDRGVLR